jgi:hypothetical protein
MKTVLALLSTVALSGDAEPALARGPIVCIAASLPADAGKALGDVVSLEFYSDEGDPLKSYSVPFTRVQSEKDAQGRVHNAYSIHNPAAIGATIVFSEGTPLSFTVVELRRTYTSLAKNDEETAFMADAVPGVVCYSVTPD